MVTKISITGTSTSIPCRRAHNSQYKRFYHNTTANARGDGRFFPHFTEKMIEQMLKKDFDQITEDMVAEHKEELYKELKSVEQIEWIPDKQEL